VHSVPARRQTPRAGIPWRVLGTLVPWTGRVLGVAPPDAWAGPRMVGTRPDGRSGRHQGSGFCIRMPPPGHTHRHNRASGKDPPQCPGPPIPAPAASPASHPAQGRSVSRTPPLRHNRGPDVGTPAKPRHEDQVAQVPNDTIGRELLGTIHKPILPSLADPHPCLGIDVPCRPGSRNIARDRQARRRDRSPRIHWPA